MKPITASTAHLWSASRRHCWRVTSRRTKDQSLRRWARPKTPNSDSFRVPPDVTQETRVEGLPFGTRGGIRIPYTFPQDGEYDVQAWLTRDRNEHVEGLREPHEMEVLLDRKRVASFTVKPPGKGESNEKIDAKLKTRITATAGPHDLGVTFVAKPASLLDTKRQPYQAHWNYIAPRINPAIYQVTITGPYNAGVAETPSRRCILNSVPPCPAGRGGAKDFRVLMPPIADRRRIPMSRAKFYR